LAEWSFVPHNVYTMYMRQIQIHTDTDIQIQIYRYGYTDIWIDR